MPVPAAVAAGIKIAPFAISGLKALFGGRKQRRKAEGYLGQLEGLAPRLRSFTEGPGMAGRDAQMEALRRLTGFDPMAGFDTELTARTRPQLQSIRESGASRGIFRGGSVIRSEQDAVSEAGARMLGERNRLALAGHGALFGAGGELSERYLRGMEGESDIYSGLADYYTASGNQARQSAFDEIGTLADVYQKLRRPAKRRP